MFGMKGEEEYGGRGGRSSHSTLSNSLTFRSLLQIRSASPFILLFKFNLKPSTHLPSRNFLPYPESILELRVCSSRALSPAVPCLPDRRAGFRDPSSRGPYGPACSPASFPKERFFSPIVFEFLHFWFSFLVWH